MREIQKLVPIWISWACGGRDSAFTRWFDPMAMASYEFESMPVKNATAGIIVDALLISSPSAGQ